MVKGDLLSTFSDFRVSHVTHHERKVLPNWLVLLTVVFWGWDLTARSHGSFSSPHLAGEDVGASVGRTSQDDVACGLLPQWQGP